MVIHPKAFQGVARSTPYLAWSASGMLPDQVKANMIAILEPYFNNPSVLSSTPVEILAFEAVSVDRLSNDPWCAEMLTGVLKEYRSAFAVAPDRSIDAFLAWEENLQRAQSEFFSLYVLEQDKRSLGLEEFRVEIFRNIGAMLEACVQPQSKAILHQIRIRQGRGTDLSSLENLRFGTTIEELACHLCVPELIAPPPWGLKLHNFRNIAQHHSTSISGDRIVCRFLIGKKESVVDFSRDELLIVARRIMQILNIMRSARVIFCLDNEDVFPTRVAPEPRKEIEILIFTTAIASQGFEVLKLDLSKSFAQLWVQDVTNGDAKARGVHASQFLIMLWVHSQADKVRVIYIDRDGQRRLIADSTKIDCEDIAAGETPFEVFATRVVFSVPAPA